MERVCSRGDMECGASIVKGPEFSWASDDMEWETVYSGGNMEGCQYRQKEMVCSRGNMEVGMPVMGMGEVIWNVVP